MKKYKAFLGSLCLVMFAAQTMHSQDKATPGTVRSSPGNHQRSNPWGRCSDSLSRAT